MVGRYKVGDRVRFVADSGYPVRNPVGTIVKVININNQNSYMVRFPILDKYRSNIQKGKPYHAYASQLRKV